MAFAGTDCQAVRIPAERFSFSIHRDLVYHQGGQLGISEARESVESKLKADAT